MLAGAALSGHEPFIWDLAGEGTIIVQVSGVHPNRSKGRDYEHEVEVMVVTGGCGCAGVFRPRAAGCGARGRRAGSRRRGETAPATLTAQVWTPRRVHGPVFSFTAEDNILIAGRQVAVAASVKGSSALFGVDADGDGRVDAREMQAVRDPMAFTVNVGGATCSITFEGVIVRPVEKTATARGSYYVRSCHQASIGGATVRLIDDNLDGKITQDGADAVLIGDGIVAQPLRKVHQLGEGLYALAIAEDGSTVKFSAPPDAERCKVMAPLATNPALAGLAIEDAQKGYAFDLATAGAGVPAGNYRLAYGVLSGGPDVLLVVGGPRFEPMAVAAGENALGLGAGLRLEFRADVANGQLLVQPDVAVVGAAGERYRPVKGIGLGKPKVEMLNGSQVLDTGTMAFG